jgi:hypothetical protein
VNDEDLERALESVADFHSATVATPNTVLAAYMRAHGIPPMGAAWKVAKDALHAGLDYRDAVALAFERYPPRGAHLQEHRAGASHVRPVKASVSQDGSPPVGIASGRPPQPDSELSPTSPASTRRFDGEQDLENHADTPIMRLRSEDEFGTSSAIDTPLEWFPKVFGPGDIDGTGAAKLLGTPNAPLSTVLVREMAQNSWDARLGGTQRVLFSLNLRRVSDPERSVLRDQVLSGEATDLGLGSSFAKDDLWVLEVSDRGTKGLGGPVRNDIRVPVGDPTNYIDLILNVGAPRDVHLGGGTYGFGKTISYRVSRVGTLLVWSRSREPQGLEDRLIGSAIGRSFELGERRYTGRHWWGVTMDQGDRIEPLTGPEASSLASRVFRSTFEPGQTGTSLLIVDPELGGETREQDAQRLADAVLWNLWPKLVNDHEGNRPMHIEVLLDGTPITVPPVTSHPILAGYADALQLVRAKQLGYSYTPRFNTEVFEVNSLRPQETLGHIAISRYGWNPQHQGASEIAPFSGPSSHVAWMRHEAELLVKYDAFSPLDTEGLQWAGVFKPTAEADDAYALAEPPAHDDWVPDSIVDRRARTRVRNGLNKVRDRVREFLAPAEAVQDSALPKKSTAALADSLSRLVGGLPGSGPTQRRASTGSQGRSKPQARILNVVRGEPSGDLRLIRVRVGVSGTKAPVGLAAHVGVGVEGALMDDAQVEILGWSSKPDGADLTDVPPTVAEGDEAWLLVRAHKDLAVELALSTTDAI